LNGAFQLPISSTALGPLNVPSKEDGPSAPGGAMKDPEKLVLPVE
jgi:hypothetical protein